MYAMAAVLSVWTSKCLSCISDLKWRRASHTSSQWCATAVEVLSWSPMLHARCTWRPSRWQRHLWRQHVWTLELGEPLPIEKQGPNKGWRFGGRTVLTVTATAVPCHLRSWSQRWSGLIWSNSNSVTAAADAICPRSLWNCLSGTALLLLIEFKQFSIGWARFWLREVMWVWPSPTPSWEKRYSVQGRILSFPSWPEAPDGCPCVCITDPVAVREWASHRGSF